VSVPVRAIHGCSKSERAGVNICSAVAEFAPVTHSFEQVFDELFIDDSLNVRIGYVVVAAEHETPVR
jgi:hypothetical protein